jgi:hypothetical protein
MEQLGLTDADQRQPLFVPLCAFTFFCRHDRNRAELHDAKTFGLDQIVAKLTLVYGEQAYAKKAVQDWIH